jgi:hypothetical protein
MKKSLSALFISLGAAAAMNAVALDLPWEQQSANGKTPQYCTGFVVGGLASKQVGGDLRTDLWLAWNYVIRGGAIAHKGQVPEEFAAGRAQFQTVADNSAAENLLEQADGNCGLGRSGHQITGW